jgi:hypothetical protein
VVLTEERETGFVSAEVRSRQRPRRKMELKKSWTMREIDR